MNTSKSEKDLKRPKVVKPKKVKTGKKVTFETGQNELIPFEEIICLDAEEKYLKESSSTCSSFKNLKEDRVAVEC